MANRLKNALWLIVGAVVAVWALTSLVGLVRAGDMDPPGPPGGTMKTLIAVEPRTVIWQPDPEGFPIVISQPGSYYLGENITGEAGKDGIHIRADNVTLDLNGFTLKGVTGSYNGITVPYPSPGAVYNLSIFNGTIRDWGDDGICASTFPCGGADDSHYRDLRLLNNGQSGMNVASAVVTDCLAEGNDASGIYVDGTGTVTRSISRSNGFKGIQVMDGAISNCLATSNGGVGIFAGGASLVVANKSSSNETGIYVADDGARVEGNSLASNTVAGLNVAGSHNLIIKNSATGNGSNPATDDYQISGVNAYGQIVNMTGSGAITADPWANFRY